MKNKLLDDVIKNGMDFLKHGIEQFDEKPKYSVINFCAGIELILKAILMAEHWSLIVDGEPNYKSFLSGNFKSISFKNLLPRINDVTKGKIISKEALNCFNSLAEHRNRMIHFSHEAITKESTEKIKEAIAIKQSNAWLELKSIIDKKCNVLFSLYNDDFKKLDWEIKKYKKYIEAAFNRIKPEIDKKIHDGITFKDCPRCQFQSSEEIQLTDDLYCYKCLICFFSDFKIKTECLNCENSIEIDKHNINDLYCHYCGRKINLVKIFETLDTNPQIFHDDDNIQINCAICMSSSSVIQHHKYFICTKCLYVDTNIQQCEWCNESQLGGEDLEFSHYEGCEFCEGRAGWEND